MVRFWSKSIMVLLTINNGSIEDFSDVIGLMGNFHTGSRIGRDGRTIFAVEDDDEDELFGKEWQVLETEKCHLIILVMVHNIHYLVKCL